jgi:hypothetical protein
MNRIHASTVKKLVRSALAWRQKLHGQRQPETETAARSDIAALTRGAVRAV